MNAFNVCL